MTDRSVARNRMLRLTVNLVICAILSAWSIGVWGRAGVAPTDVEVAEKFVVALNKSNAQEMGSASGCPFVFRNQEWESAKDGSGFVHGKVDDKSFKSKKAIAEFFGTLVSKVKLENEKAAAHPPSKDSLLLDNFKGAPAEWRKLNLVVFGRGFGDVEHVAIVGVDSGTHRVRGLYLN